MRREVKLRALIVVVLKNNTTCEYHRLANNSNIIQQTFHISQNKTGIRI